MSATAQRRAAVRDARQAWQRAEREIVRARVVHDELLGLHDRVERDVETSADAAVAAVDRFGRPDESPSEERQDELGYLRDPLLTRDDSQQSAIGAARQDRGLDERTTAAFDRVDEYAAGEDIKWSEGTESVLAAFATALRRDDATRIDYLLRIEALAALFNFAREAATVRRDERESELDATLRSYVEAFDGLPADVPGQPIALLPVRLETRFVRTDGDDVVDASQGPPTDLRVRVYPDQIHIDSHEPELTDEEVMWGHNFWTAVWYASHPQFPERSGLSGDELTAYLDEYYDERLPDPRLRAVIDGIDPDGYSEGRFDRYGEIKDRAWGQLVDRFGRERAAYVVHATAPENPPETPDDGRFSDHLLRPPEDGATGHELPGLRFPDVPRRPESWTKRPLARLLPDRWIAVTQWQTAAGAQRSEMFVGDRIREPLPAGPNPELRTGDPEGDTDATAPAGMEWMTDYEQAEAVGMAFRIPAAGDTFADLDGFDPERGFSKIMVFGVRSSLSAADGSDALRELLDAHHYTDGLSLLESGTPTNVHDTDSGYSTDDDPGTTVEIECGPRLIGDRTDGDLLARALGLGVDGGDGTTDHVFDHVENADATNQRDARHANTVLWPATIGYFAQHMLMPATEPGFAGGSLWGDESVPLAPEARLEWFDAYRRHFCRYVRSRGPFPALRTGKQPYGVLPVAPIVAESARRRELERDRRPILADLDDLTADLRDELEAHGVPVEPGTPLEELVHPDVPIDRYLESEFDLATLYRAGIPADALHDADVSLEELAAIGADPAELREEIPVGDLLSSGYEVAELLEAGYTVESLADAGVPAAVLVWEGVAATALVDAYDAATVAGSGLTVEELLDAGIPVETLTAHGVPLSALRREGVSATRLRASGHTAGELGQAGYTAGELRDAGFGPDSLVNAGFDREVLATVGFRGAALSDAGRPATSLSTRFDPAALRLAGYTVEDLRETGFGEERLVEAGYAVPALVDAGADIERLRRADVPTSTLRNAGVSASDMYGAGSSVDELRAAGYSARDVAELDVSTADLVEAGYTASDLRDAGFTAADLRGAGFSAGRLKRVGYDAESLVVAEFTAEELREAGFSADVLTAAGIDRDTLEAAGFAPGEISLNRIPPLQPDDSYGHPIRASPQFARRATYGFSFDPALPLGADLDEVADEETLQWRSNARDHRLHDQLARFLRGVSPVWEQATSGLDWVDDDGQLQPYDEHTLSTILSRRAVSESIRLQGWFRSSGIGVGLHHLSAFSPIQNFLQNRLRSTLSDAGLARLDPRLAQLLSDGQLNTEIYDRYLVDGDAGTFLRMLASEPVGTIRRLDYHLDPDDLFDISELAIDASTVREVDWESLTVDEREQVVRQAFVQNLPETWHHYFDDEGRFEPNTEEVLGRLASGQRGRIGQADSVSRELLQAAMGNEASASVEKFILNVTLATKYDGNPALLRSVIRLLGQFGTLQEYISNRDRLAHIFGEGADVTPERTWYETGAPTRFDALYERLPEALREHEAAPDELTPASTYADLLFGAVTDHPELAALIPRIAEFANSLRYLAARDSATLRALLRETLDLGSHRLDAWWTSLATKRLFELREIQSRQLAEIETDPDNPDQRLFGRLAGDADTPQEVLDTSRLDDVLTGIGAVEDDPGLCVGAYAFIEDLRVEPETRKPEYVHAPSQQQATTAAVLRGAHQAHGGRPGAAREGSLGEAVAVDLSAGRVREAKRLIDGVRTGQSLATLLGYRFERRLYERSDSEVNLMQYERTLRRLFPAQRTGVGSASRQHGDLAGTTLLDGRALTEEWPLSAADIATFPDERAALAGELPKQDVPGEHEAWRRIDGIVAELKDTLDAVSDLLLAESVHQLCQGNFDAAGASLDTLAKGEVPPELTVTQTPRSAVGLTHRTFVMLDDPVTASTPPAWSPDESVTVPRLLDDGTGPEEGPLTESASLERRASGAPALNAWFGERFPSPDQVACTVTYRWETNTDEPTSHGATRVVTLEDLGLSPLDALYATEPGQRPGQSELVQRIAYYSSRNRPDRDPPIPADADVEVTLQVTPGEEIPANARALSNFLELARSFRDLTGDVRPADADDLSHQTTESDPGYDEEIVARASETSEPRRSLLARADDAQRDLEAVADQLTDRLRVLAPTIAADGSTGAATSGTTDTTEAATTTTAPTTSPGLTARVDDLLAAVDDFHAAVPLAALKNRADAVDAEKLLQELGDLQQALPPGTWRAVEASERIVVRGADQQTIADEVQLLETETPDGTSPAIEPRETDSVSLVNVRERLREVRELPFREDEPTSLRELWDRGIEREPVAEDVTRSLRALRVGVVEGAALALPEEVTVHVWSRSPVEWFSFSADVPVEPDGSFVASFDFSDIEPGVQFQYVAMANDRAVAGELGRVVAEDDAQSPDPAAVVEEADSLPHVLRLAHYREPISINVLEEATEGGKPGREPPGRRVQDAVTALDWGTLRRERDIGAEIRSDTAEISRADVEAVDSLLAAQPLDVSTLEDSLDAVVNPLDQLGMIDAVDVVEEESSDTSRVFVAPERAPDVRVRTERALENPARFGSDHPTSVLSYDASFAALLEEVTAIETAAGTLSTVAADVELALDRADSLLETLEAQLDDPHLFFRQFAALAHHGEAFDEETSPTDFAARLRTVADSLEMVDPVVLADGAGESVPEERLSRVQGTFRAIASVLESRGSMGDAGLPDVDSQRTTTIEAYDEDLEALTESLDTVETLIEPLRDGESDQLDALRRICLESLRPVLVRASYFGVYGSTPSVAVGAGEDDEATLVSQARAVVARIVDRLRTAEALEPTDGWSDRPLPERINDQRTRLETLFDDAFTVLPPFRPPNGSELQRTFADDRLLPDDDPLAAETWLQQAAHVRDRPASLREALSYSEAMTGTLHPSFDVGQLPYRDDPTDTWVGVAADPDPGRLSLITQFDAGGSIEALAGETPVTGLFVDEWVEELPSEEETTGLALNYDDPGVRPPQSILLAVPPIDGSWSADALAETIEETMSFMKYRTIDLGDMSQQFGVTHLLPGLTFPKNTNEKPDTPSVDFEMLERYNVLPIQPTIEWYMKEVQAFDVQRLQLGGGDGT